MATADEILTALSAGSPSQPSATAKPSAADAVLDALANPSAEATAPATPSGKGGFWSALGHHAMNLPHGIAQLVEHGIDVPLQALPGNAVSRGWHDIVRGDDAAMAAREAQYQRDTPNSAQAFAGAAAGEILPFALSGGAGALQKVADPFQKAAGWVASKLPQGILSGTAKVAGTAAAGGAQGALTALAAPVTSDSSNFWGLKGDEMKVGAMTGAAVPSALHLAGNTAKGAWNAAAPLVAPQSFVTRQIADKLGTEAPSVLQNLKNAQQIVPGSQPSAGQVGGSNALIQIEKALRNTEAGANAFAEREGSNNAARWNAINGVAKTPAELQAAIDTRTHATGPLFRAVGNKLTTADAEFQDLMEAPAMKDALKAAVEKAKNRREDFILPTEADPFISGNVLDYAQRALRDSASAAKTSGKTDLAGDLGAVRDRLNAWAEQNLPGLDQAKAAHRVYSEPVNTMQAGQQIGDLLSTKAQNAQGQPMISMQAYQSALDRALKAQKFGIEPQAQSALEAVAQDLQRASRSNSIRSAGSDTAYNLNADGALAKLLYGSNFQGSQSLGKAAGAAAGALVGGPKGAAAGYFGTQKLGQFVGNRVNSSAAKLMNDPALLAGSLGKHLSPADTKVVAEIMRRLSNMAPYEAARLVPQGQDAQP
jgi:hypothetical protein